MLATTRYPPRQRNLKQVLLEHGDPRVAEASPQPPRARGVALDRDDASACTHERCVESAGARPQVDHEIATAHAPRGDQPVS